MQRYILRRLLIMFPTALLISVAVFSLLRLIPGDVVTFLAEDLPYVETEAEMRRELGLDKPFHLQYLNWIGDLVTGDLGTSLWTKRPVADDLARRWPVTVELAVLTMLVTVVVGVPVGIIAAVRQDTWVDYFTRSLAIMGIAAPAFWIGTLVLVLPAIWWSWTPPLEYVPITEDVLGNLAVFIIPALVMGFQFQGRTVRMLRAMMLETMRQDYIRTAWSKGLSERAVILRHVLRNALIPVVTLLGHEVAFVLGGVVVIEQIFNLPGMGSFTLDLLERRDYVPAQSIILLFAGIVMVSNLVVDISYTWLDPRIRYR